MLCWFLPYDNKNKLYVYIQPLCPEPPCPTIPPLYGLKQHRVYLPVLCSSFPLAIYLHMVLCIFQWPPFNSFHARLPPAVSTHLFSTSASLCLPGKQVHMPFFQIPYMGVNIWYLLFSLRFTSLCITGSRFIHLSSSDSHQRAPFLLCPMSRRATSSGPHSRLSCLCLVV